MSWQGIEGHDALVERFRLMLRRGRMASTFLFVGPEGVGKRSFALALARAMMCQNHAEAELLACGQCPSCVQAAASTHPDILQVAKPEDKSQLPIDLLIGDKEHRMREGLCYEVGLKPFMGFRKFAIIDDADYLNEEGANSLLKTLEEPPPGAILVLISTSLQRQLPTIRSRCQVIRFAPLPPELLTQMLLDRDLADDRSRAASAAAGSDGGLASAIALLAAGGDTDREPLLAPLCRERVDIAAVEAAFEQFAKDENEKKSKNKQAARDRSRQALEVITSFYRQWLRLLVGGEEVGDRLIRQFAANARKNGRLDAEQVLQCLERTLEAQRHIDRNAYGKLWPLALAADLAAIYRGERAALVEV